MTSPTETVYRSTHPDVLAAVAAYESAMAGWHERAAQVLTDLGFTGRHFLVATTFGHRHITGVEYRPGDEVLDGWRKKTSRGQTRLVPALNTKAGKAAARQVGDCAPPADVRNDLPGMPDDVWVGLEVHTSHLRRMGGAVWIKWPRELVETADATDDRQAVQLRMWERAKLSEFHAAIEEQEAVVAS